VLTFVVSRTASIGSGGWLMCTLLDERLVRRGGCVTVPERSPCGLNEA